MLETIIFFFFLTLALSTLMLILVAIGCYLSPSFKQEVIDDWNRK